MTRRAIKPGAELLKIELWPVSKPLPYARNARKIGADAIAKVALSLKEYGWRQPIVVDTDGVVVVGHTRLLAAKHLELDHVPVHVATDLTPEQIKAYRLMDNKSHESSLWDVEKLGEELFDLKGLGVELDVTGFDDFELEMLLPTEEGGARRLFQTETVAIPDLKPHPRNYRKHPEDQLEHIIASIRQHGFYRNIVIARENTILAGHGLVAACQKMGLTHVKVTRLDVLPDSVEALKVMAGDNEVQNRGEIDDRALTEILKEIREKDQLLGSGLDDMMLANLLFVTRPASEIKTVDRAAEWVGMPEFGTGPVPYFIRIEFLSAEDRLRYIAETGLAIHLRRSEFAWSARWPERHDDLSSLKFEASGE